MNIFLFSFSKKIGICKWTNIILFPEEIRVVIQAKFPTRPIGPHNPLSLPLNKLPLTVLSVEDAMLSGCASRALSHHFRDCDLHFHFTLTYCTFQTFHLSSPRPLKPCCPDTAITQKHNRVSSNYRCFGTPSKPPGEIPLLFNCFRFTSSFYQMGFVFFSFLVAGIVMETLPGSSLKRIKIIITVARLRCIFQRLVIWYERNKSLGLKLKCCYYKICILR